MVAVLRCVVRSLRACTEVPSVSRKQAIAMRIAKAGKSNIGIPQSVGADFVAADKRAGKKFAEGGMVAESKAMVKKEVAFMKKKGAPASMIKHEQAEAKGYACGGVVKKAAGGPVRKGMGMATRGGGRGKMC